MTTHHLTDPPTHQSWRNSQTHVILTAFFTLFGLVGFAYYGMPFFYDSMTAEYGWSRAVVTSGNALGKLLIGPLFGFIAGWLIDRYGPQRLMALGIIMMGGAMMGLGYASTLPLFYLCYIFNALGYVCGGPLPCQVLISRNFDKNRGKAMGIAYLGIAIGGTVAPLIAAHLQKSFGWHQALLILGALVIVIALPLVLLLQEHRHKAAATATTTTKAAAIPIRAILRNPNFYLLALGSMCSMAAVGGCGQHLKLYLRDQGLDHDGAARIMSLMLLASLSGRVLMGWLADVFRRKYVMILIYLLVGCAIPLLLLPPFPGRVYLFAVIFGIGIGGDYMIIPLMTGDLFGVRALGRTMGIILVADGVAESLFPMLVGALYNEATKSYALGFTILTGIALLGVVIAAFLPTEKQGEYHDNTN